MFVAKHHDGFCLFPSPQTKYSVQSSPWQNGQGDLVADVAATCRRQGLKFGVYLSPWDRQDPSYSQNAAYDRYYNAQLKQLVTSYGDLVEWWLDGAGSEGHIYNFEQYVRTLRTYPPNTLIFADLEARSGRAWQTLHVGTRIGHKKIDVFLPTTAARVRLKTLAASEAPHLREFQIYNGPR